MTPCFDLQISNDGNFRSLCLESMNSKNIDSQPEVLGTSGESLKESQQLAKRLREQNLDLAREAGSHGITINEAERRIQDHKATSVSPRFAEHVERGALVRARTPFGLRTALGWTPRALPLPYSKR